MTPARLWALVMAFKLCPLVSQVVGGNGEVDQAPWADRPPGLWHEVGTRVHGGAGAAWAHPGCSSLVAKAFAGDPGFEDMVWGQACGSGIPSGGGAADGGTRPWGPQNGPSRGLGLVVCSPEPEDG